MRNAFIIFFLFLTIADSASFAETKVLKLEVNSEVVKKAVKNVLKTLTRARAVPRSYEGVLRGFELSDLRSPMSELGLQDGDLLVGLDGKVVDGPDRLFRVFNLLDKTKVTTIDIEHLGKPLSLALTVTDAEVPPLYPSSIKSETTCSAVVSKEPKLVDCPSTRSELSMQTRIVSAEAYRESLSDSSKRARAIPYFIDGAQVGLRIFAIHSHSIEADIGLRNGDIVRFAGDKVITTSDLLTTHGFPLDLKPGVPVVLKIERRLGQEDVCQIIAYTIGGSEEAAAYAASHPLETSWTQLAPPPSETSRTNAPKTSFHISAEPAFGFTKTWMDPPRPPAEQEIFDRHNIEYFLMALSHCDKGTTLVDAFDFDNSGCVSCEDFYKWKSYNVELFKRKFRSIPADTLAVEQCKNS